MRRPLLLFALFVAAYLSILGYGWFQQGATAGELPGHAAKIEAAIQLIRSGNFGWFPDYLTGAPTATLLSFALSIPVYAPALLFFADPLVAMKATGLLLLGLGGFAAFAFGRRLDRSGWSGFAIGCAYLLSPQLLLRLGWQEHMTIVTAIPLVPLTFLAMLRVAERGTLWDALLLGVSWSAALLAWSKMGATLAIPLALFALWLFISRPECRANLVRGAVWSIPAALLLGVVPLLPLLRERGLMTVFELDPFDSWQFAYSAKSATAWLDRGGELFKVLPTQFRIDRGGYYLGFIGLLAMALTVWRTWRIPRVDRRTGAVRIFGLLGLLMFWLSLGPRTVLQGHMQVLEVADVLPDPVIPLHWLLLAAQGVFLFWCLPHGRWRLHVFVLIFGVYLFVPLFRLLEWLPLFSDLRAPDSFWILNGTFAWCVASGLAVVGLLLAVPTPRLRPLLGATVLILAAADFSTYFKSFYQGALPAALFADYRDAIDQLAQGKGRVLPVSGRYFYLDIPVETSRSLSTEALNHYLMPADTARLQTASRISATDILTYMRLSGIGSLLIDRDDPDVSRASERWFRSLLPVQFENDDFAVLENPVSLYPGFFGDSFVVAPPGYEEYVDALEIAAGHHLTVAAPPGDAALVGARTLEQARDGQAPDFQRLELAAPRSAGEVELRAPGKAGWVVLSESFHPDWTAFVDGNPRETFRVAGAFPGVPVSATDKVIAFRFFPPGWYLSCLTAGAAGWCLAIAGLAIVPVVPSTRRRFFAIAKPFPRMEEPAPVRSPIERPLVIVPTYNESDTIATLIDQILTAAAGAHILVVDDASADGTADSVKSQREFGDRVHLLSRSGKLGLGSAYRDGFRWAMDHGYDACIEIDADLSHDPMDIPRLLAALDENTDAAIGSRYLDGVRVINWPEHRLLLSAGASRFVRSVTGLPLTDATSGFKAIRVSALKQIDWSQLRADGYGFQIELHWLLWTAGCRVKEIPIVFTERRAGQTKMSTTIAIEAVRRVIQLGLQNRRPHEEHPDE